MAWTSFWYNYGVGGLIFLIGLIITFRQGVSGVSTPARRRNLAMLLGGFAFYFLFHLALMLLGSYT